MYEEIIFEFLFDQLLILFFLPSTNLAEPIIDGGILGL
jgi:hypothetical protein